MLCAAPSNASWPVPSLVQSGCPGAAMPDMPQAGRKVVSGRCPLTEQVGGARQGVCARAMNGGAKRPQVSAHVLCTASSVLPAELAVRAYVRWLPPSPPCRWRS